MVWNRSDDEAHRLVDTFAERMKFELDENWNKGDRDVWTEYTPDDCFLEIKYHLDKMENEIAVNSDGSRDELVLEYGIDVANCMLIFLDVLKLIEPAPLPKKKPEPPSWAYNTSYDSMSS